MLKKVLVATDGSKHSRKGMESAADLVKKYDADLVIVHVVEQPRIPESIREYFIGEKVPEEPESTYLESIGKKILSEAEKQARELGIQKIETVLLHGNPADKIVKYAKDKGMDMIVMGSHGLGFIEGIIMGSISRKVCNTASCSCMTVK